jgi:hypothetical protein
MLQSFRFIVPLSFATWAVPLHALADFGLANR